MPCILEQFSIPNFETLKQPIGEGRKNWRIHCLTLPYLITRGERNSELVEEVISVILGVEEVIPTSWCLVEEVSVSEPLV